MGSDRQLYTGSVGLLGGFTLHSERDAVTAGSSLSPIHYSWPIWDLWLFSLVVCCGVQKLPSWMRGIIKEPSQRIFGTQPLSLSRLKHDPSPIPYQWILACWRFWGYDKKRVGEKNYVKEVLKKAFVFSWGVLPKWQKVVWQDWVLIRRSLANRPSNFYLFLPQNFAKFGANFILLA